MASRTRSSSSRLHRSRSRRPTGSPKPDFARRPAAAGAPPRHRDGLADRDRLVLLALIQTGLRCSELIALDWADLELDGRRPSLLVRRGKGGQAPPPAARAGARRLEES